MSQPTRTIADLVNVKEDLAKHGPKLCSVLAANKEKIAITTVPWGKLEEKIMESIASCFDLPVIDLCLGAWKKHRELQEFADPKKHPPGEENEVALFEHQISSVHHPSLEISLNKVNLGTIDFVLNIALTLEGAEITIQAGCITKVRLGSCQGEVSLEWQKTELIKAESKKVSFGAHVTLADPIKIESRSGT